jgi:hypothetical protein
MLLDEAVNATQARSNRAAESKSEKQLADSSEVHSKPSLLLQAQHPDQQFFWGIYAKYPPEHRPTGASSSA